MTRLPDLRGRGRRGEGGSGKEGEGGGSSANPIPFYRDIPSAALQLTSGTQGKVRYYLSLSHDSHGWPVSFSIGFPGQLQRWMHAIITIPGGVREQKPKMQASSGETRMN